MCISILAFPVQWLLDSAYESQQFESPNTLPLTTREGLSFHGQQICTLTFSSLRRECVLFTISLHGTQFLMNFSVEFYNNLSDRQQGLTFSKGQS